MLLTDIDGVVFEIEAAMVEAIHSRQGKDGKFTDVQTSSKDHLLVKETPAEVMRLIYKEKHHD